ncbi:MAG TPA: amino acid adenylation domain-containing protein [Candidatus Acidoferrum sp.]|nr:amino acid adenylation domain-containing protein [Candidatus Acidoferrum sp.]
MSGDKDETLSAARLSENKRRLLEGFLRGEFGKSAAERPALTRRPPNEPIPLSFPQVQVWLHAQMAAEIPFYNETMTIYRRGPLAPAVLERCLLEIIRRHEIWRTTFEVREGTPVQVVHAPPSSILFPSTDLRNLPEPEREAEARRLATRDARIPFDLKERPLLRSHLVRTGDEEYRLYITLHQIIVDAVTAYSVFLPELAALYEAFSAGKPSPLADLAYQYGDFAFWQRNTLAPGAWSKHMAYWRKQLSGQLPVLEWPAARPRPAVETHRGEIQHFRLEKELIGPLRAMSQREGASLSMTMLAGLAALLHRYTGQDDLILGSLSAGRKLTETESLFGYFVNPFPLRIDLSGKPTFREMIARVRAVVLDGLSDEEVPFIKVVEEIQQKPDPSRNPIFQITLSQQPQVSRPPAGWDLIIEEISNGGSKMDLLVVLDDRQDTIFVTITYNLDLFDSSTIAGMMGHLQTLLGAAAVEPGKPIDELPILTPAEREQILIAWNDTAADYPTNRCLHELIEAQAGKTPDATAVIFEQQKVSYRELNARANRLAHHLEKVGVGPEVLVGVCMERSVDLVVALLGVLKAGGAYVPLDPEYPKDRLRMMLDDSRPPLLLTQQHLLDRLPAISAQIICLDADWHRIAGESDANPAVGTNPENLAYAIYTSGSTGQPKGVLNTHAGIVNRLLWMQDAYRLTPSDRVLQKTPSSFDVSVWEFFWPLMTGACLVVARPDGHRDAGYLIDLIRRERITTLHFVPSMLQVFLEVEGVESCDSLKRVICSGEALPLKVQERFFARSKAELHNLYGPTEAAVDVTSWQCRPDSSLFTVPIGRPIANVRIYLLDRNLQPVPVGVPGELYIAGVALARGYLNRPELTAERFIPDPFRNQPGARLYKTGDLARYRSDGSIEYLRRVDDQVKIRGFRIELGEIESVLRMHPAVRDARVIVREDVPDDRRLVAYLVLAEAAASLTEIGNYLKEKLPAYMIPELVSLGQLPLTTSGKLDRRALPAPVHERLQQEEGTGEPEDEIEKLLAELWKDALKLDRVTIYDNFLDLGGHSLLVILMVARLQSQLGVRVKPNEVAFQTLGQLAAVCRERLRRP